MDSREYITSENCECEHSFIDNIPPPLPPPPDECEPRYNEPSLFTRYHHRLRQSKAWFGLSTAAIALIAVFIVGFIVLSPIFHYYM